MTDPKDAAVAGAKVTLTSKATGVSREVSTGAEGLYVFANVLPGDYTVRIEKEGFATREYKEVRLEVGRTLTLDMQLALAQLGQAVTVSEAGAQVELTQSTVQGQVTATTVENIPLNGRNFLELAFLLPGNRSATNYDPTKTNTLEVSSAGQFGRGGNLTVDGGDNNDEVVGGTLSNFPQDAVQEFQIATNRFTAEVGRSGSSIINIITKPGTNNYHGSGFAFFRNRNLQALPATFNRSQSTPPFDRQQYGGSIGGPLIKDNLWWFFAGENRHQNAAVQTGTRDFATQKVITSSAAAPLRDALINARGDARLSEKTTFAIRYSFNRSDEVANGSLRRPLGTAANRQDSNNRFTSILGDFTSTISPAQVNSFIFHFDRFKNNIPAFPNNKPTSVPNLNLTNEIRFPSLQDGGTFRAPQRTRFTRYQFRDTFAWTIGAHTLHLGAEFQKQNSDALFDLFGSGTIFTTEDFASQVRSSHTGPPDDRDIPIAVVILSNAPVRPPFVPNINNSYVGSYIQDDWRARPNLTFNIGLRWEFDTDIFGTDNFHGPCPTPLAAGSSFPCVWMANVLDLNRSPDYKEFGPRLGFAYDPFKKGTTVIRGGYGIYYDRVVLEVPLLERLLDGRIISLNAKGGSTCNIPNPIPPPARIPGDCSVAGALFDPGTPTLASPFTGAPGPFGVGINVMDKNIAHPRVQQFSLGVQQQLWKNWIVSADGIHNFGTRFLIGHLLRGAQSRTSEVPMSCIGNAPCTVTDPLTGIGGQNITNIEPSAKTWYDGLLVSIQKRPVRHGKWSYGFNVNYTLSKTLNYANDDQIPFNGAEDAVNVIEGTNNLGLEKGYSPTDERHRLVFFGVFEMPYGFTISPIWTFSSGVPADTLVPALSARLPILPRNALGRDIKTGADLNKAIAAWNALALCPAPAPCRAGSALSPVNPNLEFGDAFNSFDMRVTKSFKFLEHQKFELIGEVFNLFNITNIRGFNNNNYSGRNLDITSPSFYQALSTAGGFFGSGGPRAFQFAVRYSF
ncbi:MAG: TonB-dependent receptor [Acidobacteria bacterium]|nr:TonB-dependent receptor [Acidobacteriota bacterium]